jgi:hypothetical protein
MRMINSPSEANEPLQFVDISPRQMRADLLAGLAIARRTLANAKKDIAFGVKIDPACIVELERAIGEYLELIARLDSKRRTKP